MGLRPTNSDETMWGGRPRLRRVSRPGCSPTGCAGFSTVRGSSTTRSSRNGTGGRGRPPQAWRPTI